MALGLYRSTLRAVRQLPFKPNILTQHRRNVRDIFEIYRYVDNPQQIQSLIERGMPKTSKMVSV